MKLVPALLVFVALQTAAQDTAYARKVIRALTSKECFGRGYVKSGLANAEKFICQEIRAAGADPLFDRSYTQTFTHDVNTFPKKCKVSVNGITLKAGYDFIPDPSSGAVKGTFRLQRIDSVTYVHAGEKGDVGVTLKRKLTYGVGNRQERYCQLEIDRNRFREIPKEITIDIKPKLVKGFKSKNIGCLIKGNSTSDSIIVFSAHYDHLGGIGDDVYFPGANDNASGVSVLLNLIRYYKAHPPKYLTAFIFFAGEEAGLVGSRYLAANPTFLPLKKIKFLVNLDLLGTGDDGIMVVNGAVHEKEFALLTKINADQKLVKEVRKRGKAANSDHHWFTEAGVPCFFIYTMGGIKAYHDVYDIEPTLPLTDYVDVFTLLTGFVAKL